MMTEQAWGDPGDEAAFAALVAEYDKREAPGAGARPASTGQHPAGDGGPRMWTPGGSSNGQPYSRLMLADADTEWRNVHGYRDEGVLSLSQRPVPPMLVDGVMPARVLASLFGPPESLKSFVWVDLAASVALGRRWHGHATTSTPVLGIVQEGEDTIGERAAWWAAAHPSVDRELLDARMRVVDEPVALNEHDCVESLLAMVAGWDQPPGLVIVDTWNEAMPGMNERANEDTNVGIAACNVMRRRWGATVVIVTHPGYSDPNRERGHSSLVGRLDARIQVTRSADLVTLRCRKWRGAPKWSPIRLSLQTDEATGGAWIADADPARVSIPVDEAVESWLQERCDAGRHEHYVDPDVAPAMREVGYSRDQVRDAVKGLIDDPESPINHGPRQPGRKQRPVCACGDPALPVEAAP